MTQGDEKICSEMLQKMDEFDTFVRFRAMQLGIAVDTGEGIVEIYKHSFIAGGKDRVVGKVPAEFAEQHIERLNATVKHGFFYGVRISPSKD